MSTATGQRRSSRVATVPVVVLLGTVSLGFAVGVTPGVTTDSGWSVLAGAVLLGLLGVLLRPALTLLLPMLGWAGVVLGWLLSQAALVYLVLWAVPGLRANDFWAAFWAAWWYAALMSAGLWFVTAGQPGMVTRHLRRMTRRHRRATPISTVPGVVMIQIDGLSAPLAQWAVDSGNVPTLGRWLRSGTHTLVEWRAQLPATTPASQAGLLHGASAQIPAFRWYEKDTGRLVVTNHPPDSALVEARCSDGDGLLADGGVSVSNVFSGDAPTSLLTMSSLSGRRPNRDVVAYLLDPFGLTHSLFLTIGEIIKELHQARRQRLRRVAPRIDRTWSYILLRGVTNVLLRHLNVSILAEHMMRGAPSMYCDFVDYDEIAHHAGPARPESMASLEGIDDVLATLEELATAAPRPYRFVVLSDHGQSQGATFRQRYGLGLEELVDSLTSGSVTVSRDNEQAGRAHALRAGLLPTGDAEPVDPARPEFVVVASGNLGLIYLPRCPGRTTMEEIEERHPGLIPGLTGHPGIGWVLVRSRRWGPLVLGPTGRRFLDGDKVEGDDPLAGFDAGAADDLRRHDGLANVGDLVVNSTVDPVTREVAAFEELVGCHGGLGGWQNRPVLIHPADWPVTEELDSADAVHRQLKRWLRR